jgi:transcriptional regulator with XRE-family HTH domain
VGDVDGLTVNHGQRSTVLVVSRMVYGMDFAQALRALMAKRGISGNALARRAYCDKAYISRVVNGKQPPSAKLARLLDEALSADGQLAALAAPSVFNGEIGPESRERLAWAVQHPRRIDGAAVDALASVLASQRHAEDVLGSAAILRPVLAQLRIAADLAVESRGLVRAAVIDLAGQWAQFAGWLHANTRNDAAAGRLYDRALEWAVEAADVNLISEVISMKGHIAWMAGHPGPVIGLSRAAQRDPAAFPGQHAISAAQEARGHAMAGDADAAERKLDDAMTAAQAAAERPKEAPPWLYYHSPAFFDLQRGLTYRFLAADPRYRERAIQALEAGHAGLPDSEKSSDWGAVFLCYLADVHERGGDLKQACAVAAAAAHIARQTHSQRLRGLLAPLRVRLAARLPADPDVAALSEALR